MVCKKPCLWLISPFFPPKMFEMRTLIFSRVSTCSSFTITTAFVNKITWIQIVVSIIIYRNNSNLQLLLIEIKLVDYKNRLIQVQGGDSDRLGLANFHPFYITSDKAGGFNKKQDHEKGKKWNILFSNKMEKKTTWKCLKKSIIYIFFIYKN